ncbi:MAG TPA: hypothetical protein VGJ45_28990 [Pseudonocardiaceae bacterium]|jgi:preprotein translocase subunit SecA
MRPDLSRYQRIAAKVDSFEREMRARSDDALRGLRAELRDGGGDLDALLPMAFAAAREAARRTLGERMYHEQLLGAVALNDGAVVEMNTGEGKTLTAVAPAYLHALTGHGVHVLTGDDYLAKRDADWMTPVYQALGLTCGLLADESAEARRAAYAADVTYGNCNEFAYDFLRDSAAWTLPDLRQRERRFAIVDEADLVMIDNALSTPQITAPDDTGSHDLAQLASVASQLRASADYLVEQSPGKIELTDAGATHAKRLLGISSLDRELRKELRNSLYAKEFWRRDRDYIVDGDQIRVIDWHTGRITGKGAGDVLAALAAQEGLPIPARTMTLTRISVRGYLLGYQRLTAMTGVAITDTDAYQSVYGLPVVTIPPFRPVIRVDNQTKLYGSEQSRAAATVREVVARHATGQPVLVGTSSIEYSEQLSALLTEAGVPHRVLNAKHHAEEARIIARAAELGAVTVITKMAGRGVDIRLGGDLPEQRARVVAAGGLYVLGTNVFQTWRLEQHLRGRAGRQGDPGESDMFYSVDDSEMRGMMGRYRNFIETTLRSTDTPTNNRITEYAFQRALRRHAERMSAHLIEQTAYDVVFDEQRAAISRRRQAALRGADLRAEIVGRLTGAKLPAYDQREAEVDAAIGTGAMRELERRVTVTVIDKQWRAHIRAMDDLDRRQGDDVYRRAAAKVFAEMLAKIDEEISGYLFNLKVEKG